MTDTSESDEALLARYARGDAHAFAPLYARHELRVWRYLLRNVGNRASAEELMQEVWFAVARDAASYQPTARFTSWLFTIARNRLIDLVRTRREHSSLEALGYDSEPLVGRLASDPARGPHAALEAHQAAAALGSALGQLPQEQRDAFLLQMEGDFSVEEIAAITRSSFETTKSRLRYARARLRELLTEHV